MNIRTYLSGLSRQEKQWRREGSKISTRLSLLPVFHQNYLHWKPRHPRRAERRRRKSYKSQLMQILMVKFRKIVYTQIMQIDSVGEINKGTAIMMPSSLISSQCNNFPRPNAHGLCIFNTEVIFYIILFDYELLQTRIKCQ